jgi:hypothetical protein
MNSSRRFGLTVVETGWLLQKTEAQVRGMLKRGELSYAVDRRLIDVRDVQKLLPSGDRLVHLSAAWLTHGLVVAPSPAARWGKPAPLSAGVDALLAAAAFADDGLPAPSTSMSDGTITSVSGSNLSLEGYQTT